MDEYPPENKAMVLNEIDQCIADLGQLAQAIERNRDDEIEDWLEGGKRRASALSKRSAATENKAAPKTLIRSFRLTTKSTKGHEDLPCPPNHIVLWAAIFRRSIHCICIAKHASKEPSCSSW